MYVTITRCDKWHRVLALHAHSSRQLSQWPGRMTSTLIGFSRWLKLIAARMCWIIPSWPFIPLVPPCRLVPFPEGQQTRQLLRWHFYTSLSCLCMTVCWVTHRKEKRKLQMNVKMLSLVVLACRTF